MLTVTTAAATTALTTLAAVKTELEITKSDDDAWLQRQIGQASLAACNYLGIEMAEDGTRNFGREDLIETVDRRSRYPWVPPFGVIPPLRDADSIIRLARRPVVAIASITENGAALDPADFQMSATAGIVKRLSSELVAAWPCTLIVVTYTAGWLLPGQSGRNLPLDIEQAVIELVKEARFARKRDPSVRSEDVSGIRRVDYFFGAPNQGSLPPSVTAKLDPYRNIHL